MARFSALLKEALRDGRPFALGIITGNRGSSPQKKGAKALFFADGRILGTLGGGCLEAEIQDRARRALATGEPASFELILDHDFGWDDGLICGGKVSGLILPRAADAAPLWKALIEGGTHRAWGVRPDHSLALADGDDGPWLYRESAPAPCALWIAGSGHVAQAIAPLALQMDFEVTVFDDRPSLANTRHFPAGTRFEVDAWERLLEVPFPARPVLGVVVTRGHQHDALVLARWIRQPFVFLGMIGSRRKRRVIFDEFAATGVATEAQLAQVACPMGLEIHAVSVPEIALSVVAQCVAVRAERVHGVAPRAVPACSP